MLRTHASVLRNVTRVRSFQSNIGRGFTSSHVSRSSFNSSIWKIGSSFQPFSNVEGKSFVGSMISPVEQRINNYFINPLNLNRFTTPKDDSESSKENKHEKIDGNEKKSNEDPSEDPKNTGHVKLLVGYGLISLFTASYFLYSAMQTKKDFTWDDLKSEIDKENVAKITMIKDGNRAHIKFHNNDPPRVLGIPNEKRFIEKLESFQSDLGIPSIRFVPITHQTEGFVGDLISVLMPIALLGLLLLIFNRRTGSSGGGMDKLKDIGKSRHKAATLKNLKTSFKDVAGMDEAKEEVMEFVSFLKSPEKYIKLGAKIPKGALLVGPPGTGKTLLAKAIAGEAGVPFFSISGSDFVEMFVGVGPSRVRDLFKDARANSPCIIWIDEIDAIGRSRSNSNHGNDERENTLNQLLVEMDGFSDRTNVIVLAGTNRADILDNALLRPGRFDRQISVDAPDLVGRKEIFDVHLKKLLLTEGNEDYSKRLAALTPAMTGAEIANVCNEAALIAARRDKKSVEFIDFENAIERVIAGLERKSRILSKEEKTRVAYHEAGHAIAGWFLKHAYPLLKVSIVPRGIGTLGYAQYQPRDQNLFSTEQFDHKLCTLLAGRAAEELKFKNISTGARDDLEKVTQIIYGQIVSYGMNSTVGNLALGQESGHSQKYYSEETARVIDKEARKMVTDAYEKTLQLLSEKFDLIEKVAQHLLKNEILRKDEMQELVGPRPFPELRTYEDMLNDTHKSEE